MAHKLTGSGVALITPFNSQQEVDYPALKKMIDHQMDGGIDFLVMLGTTGESATLNKKEKYKILDFALEQVDGRIGMVAGFGGNNTNQITLDMKEYGLKGYDAILSVSPYYNKPTQEGLYQHYKKISEHCPTDIILYNVPGRTASNMSPETTIRLAEDCKNIVALKDAAGDPNQSTLVIQNKPEDFIVLSGDDLMTLPFISIGMEGLISVICNAYPKETTVMVHAALKGDYEQARKLHYQLEPLTNLIFEQGNPAGIKTLCNELGLCGDVLRLPLVNVSDDLRQRLKNQRLS